MSTIVHASPVCTVKKILVKFTKINLVYEMQPAIWASAIMHFVIFMMWQKFKKKNASPYRDLNPGLLLDISRL